MTTCKALVLTLLAICLIAELASASRVSKRAGLQSSNRARQLSSPQLSSKDATESTSCSKKKDYQARAIGNNRRQMNLFDLGKQITSLSSLDNLAKLGGSLKDNANEAKKDFSEIKANEQGEARQNPLLVKDIMAKINEMLQGLPKSQPEQSEKSIEESVEETIEEETSRSAVDESSILDQDKIAKLQLFPGAKDGGLLKVLTDNLVTTRNQVESFINDNLGFQMPTETNRGSSDVSINELIKTARSSKSRSLEPEVKPSVELDQPAVYNATTDSLPDKEDESVVIVEKDDSQSDPKYVANKTILEIIELLSRLGAQSAVDGDYENLIEFLDKLKWLTIAYNFGY